MIYDEEFPFPDTVAAEIALRTPVYVLDWILPSDDRRLSDVTSLVGCSAMALRRVLLDHEVLRKICVGCDLPVQKSFAELVKVYNYWNIDDDDIPYDYFVKYWRSVLNIKKTLYVAAKKSAGDARYLTFIESLLHDEGLTCSVAHLEAVGEGLSDAGSGSLFPSFTAPYEEFVKAQRVNPFLRRRTYPDPCLSDYVGIHIDKSLPFLHKEYQYIALADRNWHQFRKLRKLITVDREAQIKCALENSDLRVLRSLHPTEEEILVSARNKRNSPRGSHDEAETDEPKRLVVLDEAGKKALSILLDDLYYHDRWQFYYEDISIQSDDEYEELGRASYMHEFVCIVCKARPRELQDVILYEQLVGKQAHLYGSILRTLLGYQKCTPLVYQPHLLREFVPKYLLVADEKSKQLLKERLTAFVIGDPQMMEWVVSLNL